MAKAKLSLERERVVFILVAWMMALAMTSLAKPLLHDGDNNPLSNRNAPSGNGKAFTSTVYGYGSSSSSKSAHFHPTKGALSYPDRSTAGGPDSPHN
ncbi:hypothetical protein SLE2022_290240 [Rubroshorea leprosula]